MPETARRLLRHALPAAALLVAALVVVTTLSSLAGSRWAGPVSDFWLFIPKVAAYEQGASLWSILWEPYGGHRLVLPKLLYLVEYEVFGGRNLFLVSCSVALQALTAALLVAFTWRRGVGLSRASRVFLAAVAVMLLFSSTQLENFSRGWNVHHFLACTGAVAALLALAEAAEARASRRVWVWLALCGLCALAATYSMAIALPVWPLLWLFAWRARLPRAGQVALAGLAALALAAFFAGHRAAQGGAFERRLDDPAGLLYWAAACLGGPLSWTREGAGLALVVLALLGVAAAALHLLVSGRRPRPLEILGFGLVGLGAGAALLASYGRVAGHAENWDAHRYQSFVMLFWLGVFVVGTLASAGGGRRRALRALLALAALAWVAGALLPAHFREEREVRAFAARVRAAHDALLVGVPDRKAYLDSLPKILWRQKKTDMAAFARPFLARRELGMFAEGRQRRLGLRVDRDFEAAPEGSCRGSLVNVRSVAGHPNLVGDVAGGAEILVSDAAGRVVGLGRAVRPPPAGPDQQREGFAAWVEATRPGSPLTLWTLLPDGRLCRIAGPLPFERGYRGKPAPDGDQMRRSAPSQ